MNVLSKGMMGEVVSYCKLLLVGCVLVSVEPDRAVRSVDLYHTSLQPGFEPVVHQS